MDVDLKEIINSNLVKFFREIMELEEQAIITEEFQDITNNDMHIIEAIGPGEGNCMTPIAKKLNITVSSLTTSMNALVRKGYVERVRSSEDRRIVNIRLLDKGLAAYKHHEAYHQRMTDALVASLTPEEVMIWVKSFHTLNDFFRNEAKR